MEAHIDVRLPLLNRTYEERIFHTVMQRDQRFQILIGSKKKELCLLLEDGEHEVNQDRVADEGVAEALTADEMEGVMMDHHTEQLQSISTTAEDRQTRERN